MPSVQFTNETAKIVKDKDFVTSHPSDVSWTVDGGSPPAGFKKEAVIRGGLCFGFKVSFPTETTGTVAWSVS